MNREEIDHPPAVNAAEDLALCAHEIRGTLTVIAGYANMLRRSELTPEQREQATEGIEEAVMRADRIMADTVSGLVRTGSGAGSVEIEKLVLRSVADARASSGREVHGHVLGSPMVSADAVALARVLENLLSNAAKYAPEGDIAVDARTEGDWVIVEVSDRGPGIPADQRERVLEPFARLSRDESKPGTGLGLTVVRSVIEIMGGRVALDDRAGGGTVIRLEMPKA